MAESHLQTKILKDLRSQPKYIKAFKLESSSDNGNPDLFWTCQLTGPCVLEVKDLGKKPRKLQESQMKGLNDCGTKAFWCDSWSGWVDIKRSLGMNKESIKKAHVIFHKNV